MIAKNEIHAATVAAMSKSLDELLLSEPQNEEGRSERRAAVAALREAIKAIKFMKYENADEHLGERL